VGLQNLGLGGRQYLVDAAEDREGEDDILVFAALEGVADEVGDAPNEGRDLGMRHQYLAGRSVDILTSTSALMTNPLLHLLRKLTRA